MGTVPEFEHLYFSANLVPTCARCGRVRDETGHWHELDPLPAEMTPAQMTHTICPRCLEQLYPLFLARRRKQHAPD